MAKLYFRYSAMNAGKSTALLQVAHNYEKDLGLGVIVYTAEVDDRFGLGKVTSRLGISHEARTYSKNASFKEDIFSLMNADIETKYGLTLRGTGKTLGCILIDEAQFLTKAQVTELHKFTHMQNIPVICYGIRTDFAGIAFEGSATLLALADAVEELKTVCTSCKHRKATMNPRVDTMGKRILEGPQIGIEGTAYHYEPMCPRCFYESAI